MIIGIIDFFIIFLNQANVAICVITHVHVLSSMYLGHISSTIILKHMYTIGNLNEH